MDKWLHCNVCVKRVSDRPAAFYLTNCGHTFCDVCVKNATASGCAVCHNQCSVLELKDKVPEEVKMFFKSPDEIQNQALKLLRQADEARRFQQSQLKRLLQSFDEKIKKEASFLQRAMQKMEQQKKEIGDLRRHLKANGGLSPGGSYLIRSPDRSPRSGGTVSPRSSSPISHHAYSRNKTPPISYGSPNHSQHRNKTPPGFSHQSPTSNRVSPGVQQHIQNVRANVSPVGTNRLSKRSPGVPSKHGSPRGEIAYQSHDGVISKVARLSTSMPCTPHNRQFPSVLRSPATTQMPFSKPQFTPPSTPKIPFSFPPKQSPYRRL